MNQGGTTVFDDTISSIGQVHHAFIAIFLDQNLLYYSWMFLRRLLDE